MTSSAKRKYFGTDGVRGRVGEGSLTADFALRLANAAAQALVKKGGKVLIGKDTRLSGYMFESALEAGFVAAGVDVMLIGPLPTPGVAYMTKRLGCDLGIVISASHNAFNDNGIKFFGPDGGKLSDEAEMNVESFLEQPVLTVDSEHLGRASRVDELRSEYETFCISTFPEGMNLSGMKIVVDAANGAAYKVAPRIFAALGAEVTPVGTSPNGKNINDGCGATAPQLLQMMVSGTKADVGIAVDGDGDRLIMVDHEGAIVDGDRIVYMLARAHKKAGTLKGPVVGTVMSNMGIEEEFKKEGIAFLRAQVGDRHILEMLKKNRGILGGEPSGHILTLDKTTTGDAIIAAIQALAGMQREKKSLKELSGGFPMFPQVSLSVPVARKLVIEDTPEILKKIEEVEKSFKDSGRVVLRASGTEPVIRVMVEAKDAGVAEKYAQELAGTVRSVAG